MAQSNQGQREFWSNAGGADWVAWQSALDTALAPVSEVLLEAADLQPAENVVDIGCGTGAVSLAAGDIVGPMGRVTGLDISAAMLDAARGRTTSGQIAYVLADAQVDPMPGFDVMVSRFGMMFFADPLAAFRNIAAHGNPGARLKFICWNGMPGNPWFRIPFEAAAKRLGPLSRLDANAPGPTAFKDANRVTGLISDAGFADAKATRILVDLSPSGAPDDVARLLMRFGPAGRALREKNGSAEDAKAIEDAIRDALHHHTKAGQVRFPADLWLFSATLPA